MTIVSDMQLRMVLNKAITRAIYDVLQRIFRELQKEIERDIYNAYSPEDYQRTNALLDAWEQRSMHMAGEINFKSEWLPIVPSAHQHGSLGHGGYTDIRDIIFDILESGYGAYNYHTGKPIPPRPMWDKFMQKVNKNFDKWMRKALKSQGLLVI